MSRKKKSQSSGPIPWIGFQAATNTYQVFPEATRYLESIQGPIAVMSVVGSYRTGKSYLLNKLINHKASAGFKVSPTIKSCTKGLWLMCPPLEMDGFHLLVIDTEGLGSLSASAQHDLRVFSLAMLLSSIFLYNATGAINENALQSVSLVAKIAQHVKLSSDDDTTDAAALGQYFPHFVWCARDFALQLVGDDNEPISPTTYLNNALRVHGDPAAPKNKVRNAINALFPKRDCVCMVRPVTDESKLQHLDTLPNDELRGEFLEALAELKATITSIASPMKHGDMVVTGPLLAGLCNLYVNAINEGAVPAIKDSWSMLSESTCRRAADEAREAWKTKRRTCSSESNDVAGLLEALEHALDDTMNMYDKQAVGSAAGGIRDDLIASFRDDIATEQAEAVRRIQERIREHLRALEKKASREAATISAIVDIFEADLDTLSSQEERSAWYPEAFRGMVRVIESMTVRLEKKHHELQRKVDGADLEMSKLRSKYDNTIKSMENEVQRAKERCDSIVDAKELAERQFDDILRKYEERENTHKIEVAGKDESIRVLEEKMAIVEQAQTERHVDGTVPTEELELKLKEIEQWSAKHAEATAALEQAVAEKERARKEADAHLETTAALQEQLSSLLSIEGQYNEALETISTLRAEKDVLAADIDELESKHEEETMQIQQEALSSVQAIREVLKKERTFAEKAKQEHAETLRVLQEKAEERATNLEGQRDQAEELAKQRRDQLDENKKAMAKERDHLRGEIDRYANMFKDAQKSNDEARRDLLGQLQSATREFNDRERTMEADKQQRQQETDEKIKQLEMERVLLTAKLDSTERRREAVEKEMEATRQKLGNNQNTNVELMKITAELKHTRQAKDEAVRAKKESDVEIQTLRKKIKDQKRESSMSLTRLSMQYEKQISILESRLLMT